MVGVWSASFGGTPWHEPQKTWPTSPFVQTGARTIPAVVSRASLVPPLWQYASAQVADARSHAGLASSALARPLYAAAAGNTSAGRSLSMWPAEVTSLGTRWHSAHAIGPRSSDALVCAACA